MLKADVKGRLRDLLLELKWRADTFGHFHKTITGVRPSGEEVTKTYRIRIQATSCRVEVRGQIDSQGKRPWIRVGGGYFKDFVTHPDGSMQIGSHRFGKMKV